MSDGLSVYLIVGLNISVQLMLIRSLRFPPGGKRKYYLLALAIPIAIMLAMRLLVASGVMHGRVAEQSLLAQLLTQTAGVVLMASPWLVTAFAIVDRHRREWIKKLRAETDEPV